MVRSAPNEAKRDEVEKAITEWRDKRTERLAEQKKVDKLEEQEKELKSWLIEVFRQQKMEGMIVGGRSTGLSTKETYTVLNKEELVQYIYDNEAIELLQFRLAVGAIDEREEAGDTVPGLGLVDVYDLFDRKA